MSLLFNLQFLTKRTAYIILPLIFIVSFISMNTISMLVTVDDFDVYEIIRLYLLIFSFSGLLSISFNILTEKPWNLILKVFFLMLMNLIIVLTFSVNKVGVTHELYILIEICSIMILMVGLSILFYIYPVFSRTLHLHKMMHIHITIIILLLISYIFLVIFQDYIVSFDDD